MTKLSNIQGRANYITDPARQEHIVAKSFEMDWSQYADFENRNRKSANKNNEGRELMIALPNEWSELQNQDLRLAADRLAKVAIDKNTDYQWAVHWNKSKTNLHMHVIFSERSMLLDKAFEQADRWDRDIYHTNDGKVARSKKDRATDIDGNVKPPVHKKGDLKNNYSSDFTPKDPKYKNKKWLEQIKENIKLEMIYISDELDINRPDFKQDNLIPEYHVGKGNTSAVKWRANKNNIIQFNNEVFEKFKNELPLNRFDKFNILQKHEQYNKKILFAALNDDYFLRTDDFRPYEHELEENKEKPRTEINRVQKVDKPVEILYTNVAERVEPQQKMDEPEIILNTIVAKDDRILYTKANDDIPDSFYDFVVLEESKENKSLE